MSQLICIDCEALMANGSKCLQMYSQVNVNFLLGSGPCRSVGGEQRTSGHVVGNAGEPIRV